MIITEKKMTVSNSADVAEIMQKILLAGCETDLKKEHMWSIGLSSKNTIEYIELCFLGTLNKCVAHPREIFRLAVMKSVCSIIIVHNHPSGNTEPSREDESFTKKLFKAGKILEIEVLDHIIIAENDYFSFSSNGMLTS